jgi:hypothetical protein|tara:strand:+ start:1252 stop:1473 length:222 start_codon:yes stop_codon:yes gene_type:complete
MGYGLGQKRLQDRVTELEKNQKPKATPKPKAEPAPATPGRQRTVTAKKDTRSRRNLMRGSAMREPVISSAYDE